MAFKRKNLWFAFGIALGLFAFCCVQFSRPLFKVSPSQQSHPLWMQDQIREDLTPFLQKGIKRSDLQKAMYTASPQRAFLHVKIHAGKVSFSSDEYFASSEKTRSKHVKNFFCALVKRYQFPDVEFIVCLLDAFDEREGVSIPLFVFAKQDTGVGNVLIPDFEALRPNKKLALYKQAVIDHPWSTKKELIFWRGATTGGDYARPTFLQIPRMKLVCLSREHPDKVDAAFSVLSQATPETLDRVLRFSRPLAPYASLPEHFAYKYLIDVDGNSCTYERCRWILLSNSTLLKPSSPNLQWYYKALQPYVHYVPLKADLSDLLTAYEWLKGHDVEARNIADAGRELGLALFSDAAIQEYVATLISEYSQLYHASE